MEHRIAYGDDELHDDKDNRYVDLSNDEARYDECNAGYDVDNDLGGYDNTDSCANAEYFYNVGQYKYDADDEHNAVNDGADKYDDVNDKEAYDYDNEVFWWSGNLQDGNDNGDAIANGTKRRKQTIQQQC